MSTRIFLDSGDPRETRALLELGVPIVGQTTNPSLVAHNPDVVKRVTAGELFTADEINSLYKDIVQEIAELVEESVSIEVYADYETMAETMQTQAYEMNEWIQNAHIKLPTVAEGLKAAEELVRDGLRLNMTLCFTAEQAAAVYAATRGATRGDVFLSPFIGRFDDRGEDGISGLLNIKRMLMASDGHVEVLAASVRHQDHLLACLAADIDIVTAPYQVLQAWADAGMPQPGEAYRYEAGELRPLPYQELNLAADWPSFDLNHPLVDEGIDKFVADWKKILK